VNQYDDESCSNTQLSGPKISSRAPSRVSMPRFVKVDYTSCMDDKQLIFAANSECMRIIPRNPRVAVLAGLAVEVRKRLLSNRKRVTKNGIGNAWSCVMYYLTGQKVEYSSTIRHRIDSLEKRITQWKGTIRLALGEQPLDLSVKSVDGPLAEIPGSLLHSRTPSRELGEKQKRKRIQDVEKFIENKTGRALPFML